MDNGRMKKSIKSLILNTLKDDLPNRDILSNFVVDILERYGLFQDYLAAYTNTVDIPRFVVGDTVRFQNVSIWNIDWALTEQQGYSINEKVYGQIVEVFPYRSDQYKFKITYVNDKGEVDTVWRECSEENIIIDNTMLLSFNNPNKATLI